MTASSQSPSETNSQDPVLDSAPARALGSGAHGFAHFDAPLADELGSVETLNAWSLAETSRFEETIGALLERREGQALIVITPDDPRRIAAALETSGAGFTATVLKDLPGDYHVKYTRTSA
ncbi:hypothetical protein [Corynebacterium endometrii]|uniref:Uncharacterized protein n=1 Tax=Corynebacterium endometrii TaxID=2488819 RepID=A0A4P7QF01_9CORY|nr:hypothetical protein [Corynebacterium endometrii]QCB28235.1 hypothetical protein CENDO_04730 [Corynebacterium endometrii]